MHALKKIIIPFSAKFRFNDHNPTHHRTFYFLFNQLFFFVTFID
jgi:hypothetical protein